MLKNEDSPTLRVQTSADLPSIDPSALAAQIAHLEELRRKAEIAQKQEREQQAKQEREQDEKQLTDLKTELTILDEMKGYEGKLSPEQVRQLATDRIRISSEIGRLERKLGLDLDLDNLIHKIEAAPAPEPVALSKPRSLWPTATTITGILVLSYLIVIFSGDWILTKWPGANIYNEVSFQKVLFGCAVLVTGLVCVFASGKAFFPGFIKYLNPFNNSQLDFYKDFKSETSWHRIIAALWLFSALLLSFVWIVSGKLD